MLRQPSAAQYLIKHIMDISVDEQYRKCALLRFDEGKLASTKAAWVKSAEEIDVPALEFQKTLAWVESHVDYNARNGDSYAYGVFADDCDEALAIVDIVYSTRGGPDIGWLKMLSVTLAPQFSAPVLTQQLASLVLAIYIEAVRGTVALTDVHRSRVVKLYARNDEFFKILLSLNEYIGQYGQEIGMASKFEGRFLVITAN